MELKQIEYFLKLYETKNFTKASKSLFITQQGLSRSISNLENEFGLPLFERTSKGIISTEYGARLYSSFKKADNDIKKIYKEVENIRNSCAGELRIVCSIGALFCIDMSFLLELKNRYPDIKVHYEEFPEMTADELLNTDQWDIGLLTEPIDTSLFQSVQFFREKVYAYVHKDNPLAKKSVISFQDIDGQNILFYSIFQKFILFLGVSILVLRIYLILCRIVQQISLPIKSGSMARAFPSFLLRIKVKPTP